MINLDERYLSYLDGKKNNHVEPTITTPNGEISETLMSGTLREHYMREHREY